MKRRYGFALLLAALLICAGCAPQEREDPAPENSTSQETAQDPAEGAQAPETGEAPEEQMPGADEEERVAVYEGEEISITVPARYADLVRVDDIGSDNIFVVEANLYYVPDYTEDSAPQTCGGWMLTVESLYPDIAAHTADIGPCGPLTARSSTWRPACGGPGAGGCVPSGGVPGGGGVRGGGLRRSGAVHPGGSGGISVKRTTVGGTYVQRIDGAGDRGAQSYQNLPQEPVEPLHRRRKAV